MNRFLRAFAAAILSASAAAVAQQQPNAVQFQMPADGHATLAINDAQGRRVRNLLADMPFKAGPQAIEWDGRDDRGEVVPPGSYRWTGLYRGGVHAVYRGGFQHGNPPWPYAQTGGWIADHSPAVTVARAGDDRMLLGATESEWGHGMIASDLSGQKRWGVRYLEKRGWAGADMLAVDATTGRAFATSYLGQKAVWEVDPQTGENRLVAEQAEIPAEYRAGDARGDTVGDGLRLVGAHRGEVFVTQLFADEPRTLVYKAAGKFARLSFDRALPVRPWHLAWLRDGRCVAVLDKTVEILDTRTGRGTPLVSTGLSQPHSIAVDAKDRIFVSDQGATGVHQRTKHGQLPWRYMRLDGPAVHQVKVFDAAGRPLAAVGTAGGQQVGRFDPNAFFMPAGIAVDGRGRLWVTEMNYAPKRVTVWSIPDNLAAAGPALEHQFVGPTLYGGGAAMLDPAQPWRIMDTSYGHVFDVDLAKGAYRVATVPWRHHDPWKEQGHRPDQPFTGRPGVVIPVDGRKFAAAQGGYMHGPDSAWSPHRFYGGGATMIGEYVGTGDDVRFVPRAAVGNVRMWMRGRELNTRREEQWLPPAILAAAKRLPDWPTHAAAMNMDPDAPDVPHVEHKRGSADWIVHPWPAAISGLIWVDADGDAKVGPDEVAFAPMADEEVFTLDAGLNVYFSAGARPGNPMAAGTYKLPRDGFNAAGAPIYRWDALQKITDANVGVAHVGTDGSMLSRTALHDAKGDRVWSYPSSPDGVKALGPRGGDTIKPGRVHRVNAVWGVADGPGDLGPIYMIHNNDGMVYLLTRDDGLFIASLFRPYSLADGWDAIAQAKDGTVLDEYSLQDECFNGHFARAEASGQGFGAGKYYLLGAGRSAVVEITGLPTVKRFAGGDVTLDKGKGLYAKGQKFDPADTGPSLAIARTTEPLVAARVEPGTDPFADTKPAQFLGTTVRAAWDAKGLHMKWEVRGDASPLANTETDVTQLFSTGDACDLHVASPRLGKLRFLIATSGNDTPVIVRMRYDGKATADAVTYTSGVGETVVPEVRRLAARPTLRKIERGYVAQFHIPWADLGVSNPASGTTLPIELGLISSNPTGTDAATRAYWASGGTGMVADVPTEARPMPTPGTLKLE